MPVHVIMHIYSMQSVCKFACMSMWICTFTMSRQLVTMHACACDYAHLMLCIQLVTIYARAWVMQFYATQSSCNYVCMSMRLCIFMLCGQPVTMHACACDYAYPCYAASVIMKAWHFLCTFTLLILLVTMHACSRDYVHLCYAASL